MAIAPAFNTSISSSSGSMDSGSSIAETSPFECPICLEQYHHSNRRPKVLQCGHTLCKDCIDLLTPSPPLLSPLYPSLYKCPVCRRPVAVVADNLILLQQSHIRNKLKPIRIRNRWGGAEGWGGGGSCQRRDTDMDTEDMTDIVLCSRPNKKIRVSVNMCMCENSDDYDDESSSRLVCEEHGMLIKKYCVECECAVCPRCYKLNSSSSSQKPSSSLLSSLPDSAAPHCNHALITLQQAVLRGLRKTNHNITKLEELLRFSLIRRNRLNDLEGSAIASLENALTFVEEEAEAAINQAHQELYRRKEELMCRIVSDYSLRFKSCDDSREALRIYTEQVEAALVASKNTLLEAGVIREMDAPGDGNCTSSGSSSSCMSRSGISSSNSNASCSGSMNSMNGSYYDDLHRATSAITDSRATSSVITDTTSTTITNVDDGAATALLPMRKEAMIGSAESPTLADPGLVIVNVISNLKIQSEIFKKEHLVLHRTDEEEQRIDLSSGMLYKPIILYDNSRNPELADSRNNSDDNNDNNIAGVSGSNSNGREITSTGLSAGSQSDTSTSDMHINNMWDTGINNGSSSSNSSSSSGSSSSNSSRIGSCSGLFSAGSTVGENPYSLHTNITANSLSSDFKRKIRNDAMSTFVRINPFGYSRGRCKFQRFSLPEPLIDSTSGSIGSSVDISGSNTDNGGTSNNGSSSNDGIRL